jgi:hypothetical protein
MLGCSASSPGASSSASSPPASSLTTTEARPDPPAKPAGAPQSAPPRDEPPASAPLPFVFSRVDATPVFSAAVGKPPKVAFLARGEALVFSGKGLERLPAPETRAPELSVEIYFGRDDQPRLMGHRPSGARAEPYYRRYKAGRFQPEPSELGPLAAPGGALYGVLGWDDPEVVCRPRQFCLVKRITGWGRAPAHDEPVRILLSGGTAWALHRDRIERLERDAWVNVVPERAFHEPLSLFADAPGSLFVVVASREEIVRLANGRWQTIKSPLRGPRAVWGSSATDVWLVGAGGAAHFDGKTWRTVPDIVGPLEQLVPAAPDLWLAGEGGIYRGEPAAKKR